MISSERQAWLDNRKHSLGGSDAAVALGISPWKSRLELWGEKTGKLPPVDLSGVEAVEFGVKLERIVLDTLAERTGREVVPWDQTEMVRDPDRSWMTCTPDAMENTSDRAEGLVEAKTTGAFSAKMWTDEPPLYYQVQLQHNMHVTGCTWGTLCVLIGGQKFAYFDFDRNDKFVASMISEEERFWELVQTDTPPEPDDSMSCANAIARLYPRDNMQVIELPHEASQWDTELGDIKAELKELESRRRLLENNIKAAIGENTVGMLPGGGEYTFRTQARKGHVVAASEFRVLRRRK